MQATGNIGTAIVKGLLESNIFNVTILTRSNNSANDSFPDNVKILSVDYSNATALADALTGQGAIISALSHTCLDQQRVLLQASVRAGVQRFLWETCDLQALFEFLSRDGISSNDSIDMAAGLLIDECLYRHLLSRFEVECPRGTYLPQVLGLCQAHFFHA